MKRVIFMFLLIGLTMSFWNCGENYPSAPELSQSDQFTQQSVLDKKPAQSLIGEAVIDFTFTPPTFWNGTIDFGADGKYGMTFISYDPPRDFSQASPYYEDFVIYKLGTDWTVQENIIMKGWNAGVVTYANKDPEPVKVRANGEIVEAYGDFEMWEGRKVHMQGLVYWVSVGVPDVAISTVRIN